MKVIPGDSGTKRDGKKLCPVQNQSVILKKLGGFA
jgi:hypothetical protein